MSENDPDEAADDLGGATCSSGSGKAAGSSGAATTAHCLVPHRRVLATIVVQIFIQYQLTAWNRAIFDALESRNAEVVWFQAMIFPCWRSPASCPGSCWCTCA